MPYTIDRYKVTASGWPITVGDKSLDNTTSLTLIGRFSIGWGESLNENFVHLLENFAGDTPPANPITGQLWYDTNENLLKIYNENSGEWTRLNSFFGTNLPSSASEGDISFIINGNERSIYRYDGTNWLPIWRIHLDNSTPSGPSYDGDLWYDTGSGNLNIYYSGAWVSISGGGSSSTISRIAYTTTSGTDIFVIDANDQILGAYSPTTISSGSLGTYTTVKNGTSINLSSIFPNGLKPGFNASPIFSEFVFQSDVFFGTETPNLVNFKADSQTYISLDPSEGKTIFDKPLKIKTGSDYFISPSSAGSDGSVLTLNSTTKESYWQPVSALASSVSTILTSNKLKIQFNEKRNEISDWPAISNLLLYYFENNEGYWQGELRTGLTPFGESISVTAIPIDFNIRTFALPEEASTLKIIGGSLLSLHCVDNNNNVFMFGKNGAGQLGIGNTTSPIRNWKKSLGLPSKEIKEVIKTGNNSESSGNETSYVWFEDGDLYACGANSNGSCGVNSSSNSITSFTQCIVNDTVVTASPFPIHNVKEFSFGFGDNSHAIAYVSSNSIQKVYAAGRNNKGQLGVGDTNDKLAFSPSVGLPSLTPSNRVKKIKSGGIGDASPSTAYTMVLLEDGTLWGTGYNGSGNLGIGSTTDQNSFTQTGGSLGTITNVWCTANKANTFIEIDNSGNYEYYGAGKNNNGALGIGSTSQANSWTAILSLNTNLLAGERVVRFISCSKDNPPVLCWTNMNRVFVTGKNAGVFIGSGTTDLTSFNLVQMPYFEGNIINALVYYKTSDDPGLVALFTDKDYIIFGGTTHNMKNIFIPGHHLKLYEDFEDKIYNIKGMFSVKIPRP